MASDLPRLLTSPTDGELSRRSALYPRQKLSFLREFLPAALTATKKKPSRHYVDLFAGPGRSITATQIEFDGSPLIAAQSKGRSGDIFETVDAFNLDPQCHGALSARFAAARDLRTPQAVAHLGNGLVDGVALLRQLPRLGYAFVFIDIEKPMDLAWEDVVRIRRAAPTSTDAYLLFPDGMALTRMLPYDLDEVEKQAPNLDRFFGCDAWREAVAFRRTDAHHNRQRVIEVLGQAYLAQLRTLWSYPTPVRRIQQDGRSNLLYRMLYATSHPAGDSIAKWTIKPSPRRANQRDLFS